MVTGTTHPGKGARLGRRAEGLRAGAGAARFLDVAGRFLGATTPDTGEREDAALAPPREAGLPAVFFVPVEGLRCDVVLLMGLP